MDNVKNAANYVADSVKSTTSPFPQYSLLFSTVEHVSLTPISTGATSTGSKEANKQVAKDSDASIGTR